MVPQSSASEHKSWIWTSPTISPLVIGVDQATHDRILEICTQIGTLMEDASVVALVWKIDDNLSDTDRLQQLRDANTEIGRLLDQATELLR